jgi:hypothetical protein
LLGDPDYSPTLIKQELEKRYAAERGVQDNTPDATRRTAAGRFNVDTAFPSGGLAELANQKGISAYDKNEAEYEAPSTFGRHVGALGKFSADITQKPAKGLYDYFMKPEKDPKVAAEEKRGISAILAQQNNPEQAGNTLESQEAEAAAPAPTTPTAPAAVKPPKEAEGIEGPGRKPVPPLLGQKKQGEDDTQKKPGTNWDDLRAKALTLGDDALAAQDKIREELGGKLDAADEKKKGILGKRKENLDSQKWMALAEMGASVLAQPGGQTFLQSLGKGAKESGILGTLSKLGDKAYDIETDLADMDVKTAVSKYGLSKDQYDALIKNRDSQTKRLETLDTGEYRQNRIIADNTNKENTLLFRTQQLNQATERANSSADNRAGNLAIRQLGLFETQRKNKSKELADTLPKREVIEKQLLTTDENSGTYVALLDYLQGLKNVPTKRNDGGLIKPKGTAGEAI